MIAQSTVDGAVSADQVQGLLSQPDNIEHTQRQTDVLALRGSCVNMDHWEGGFYRFCRIIEPRSDDLLSMTTRRVVCAQDADALRLL